MKQGHWKWWLLAGLAMFMCFIWYNAFRTMSSEPFSIKENASTPKRSVSRGKTQSLEYASPKINPFKVPTAKAAQPKRRQQQPKPAEPKLQLDPQLQLTGILGRGSQSQAVLSRPGGSLVLSLGDSLDVWELKAINTSTVIFGHGKNRDTLWLYTDD
jgi:hypothetical protein